MPTGPVIDRELVKGALEQAGSANAAAKLLGMHANTVLQISRELKGLCKRCGREGVEQPSGLCANCREWKSAYLAERQQRKKEEGICRACARPVAPPSSYHCAIHNPQRNAEARALRKRWSAERGEEYHELVNAQQRKARYGSAANRIWSKTGGGCQVCGAAYQKRRSHIHHIDGDRGNNAEGNLICLCNTCHYLLHYLQWHPNLEAFLPWFRATYPDTPI